MVDEITDQTFAEETKAGVVLTDFWATWCGPCKMQSPIIEQLASERQDVKFTKMDVDENKEIAQNLGIMAIPTLIIKKDGKIVDRLTGYTPKEKLDEIFEEMEIYGCSVDSPSEFMRVFEDNNDNDFCDVWELLQYVYPSNALKIVEVFKEYIQPYIREQLKEQDK